MIARGDLGIELPIEEVPLVQKRLLAVAGRRATPTITATQMLESMVHSTRPTRAEVADVANAIFDGTDAVMLSQETAVGRHPVLAVEMMASIAETTERELPYGRWLAERGPQANNQYHAIAFGAVGAVYQLGLKSIVSPTNTGTTVRLISAYRPKAPVLALSPTPDVVRRCLLLWGVQPQLHEEPLDTIDLIDACADAAVRAGLARAGDKIGITAGLPAGSAGRHQPVQGPHRGVGRRRRRGAPHPGGRRSAARSTARWVRGTRVAEWLGGCPRCVHIRDVSYATPPLPSPFSDARLAAAP